MLFPLNSIIQEQNLRLGLFGLLEESSFLELSPKASPKEKQIVQAAEKEIEKITKITVSILWSVSLPHGEEGTLWLTGHVYKCFVIEYESDRERDWIKES